MSALPKSPPGEFTTQVRIELRKVYDDSRAILATKNRSQFSTTSFHLYHEVLPVTKIAALSASSILHHRPTPGSFQDLKLAKKWETWKADALERARDIYEIRGFKPGDHVTVLMGSPGAGKTTEMKRLLLYLQDEGMTCVFVPLSIYNAAPIEHIFAAARSFYVDKLTLRLPMDFEKFLWTAVAEKHLVLMLDSLDEADGPHRRRVINHVNDLGGLHGSRLRAPVFISSRYVRPRIDHNVALGGALRWHLAGLEPAQVARHVGMLRDHLSNMEQEDRGLGPKNLSPSLQGYIKRMDGLAEHLRNLERSYSNSHGPSESRGPSEGPLPSRNSDLDYGRTGTERALRTFAGLALPLFLHLHIGLCLERGVAEWSIDSIIGRYVEFLLGKWIDSRSENPEQDQRDQGRASLERALAYLGFEFTLREHMGLADPTPSEVEKLLITYCKAMDQASSTDEELTAFVREQMDRARTAEIFEPDSSRHIRFSHPADVLREYHVAQFIEQSTAAYEAGLYRERWGLTSQKFPPIHDAVYSRFLENPNLRFLERGHLLYFQSIFDSRRFLNQQVRIRFEQAREAPPVRPELCLCTAEQLKQILPLNLLFLGRALQADLANQYREMHDQLRKELEPIYKNTHFAIVYKALRDLVHPSRATDEREFIARIDGFDPENEKHIDQIDELWRDLPNAQLLIHLAKRIQGTSGLPWRSLSLKRQILLRRIAYQLRYQAATFDEEAGEWLVWLHSQAAEQNVGDMVMATQHVIRTTLSRFPQRLRPNWWRYFVTVENRERREIDKWRRDFTRAWRQGSDCGHTELFVNRVVADNERFPLKALQRLSPNLEDLLSKREFNVQDAVAALSMLMRSAKANTEGEGKIHLFLREIAYEFRGQQLLMPEECELRAVRQPRAKDPRYRPEEILQRLFERVLPHLPAESGKLEADTAGSNDSYAGGLQPYDLAVEAIWAILYGPYSHDARSEEIEA